MTPDVVGSEIAASLDRVSKAVKNGIKAALGDVRDVAKDEHAATAPQVPGTDRKFSNWPSAGSMTLATKIEGGESLRISPKGPWGLAESGRKPGAMKAWGHPARHPGTRGRGSWSAARDRVLGRAEDVVPEVMDREVEGSF